jgi:hypothetical protein
MWRWQRVVIIGFRSMFNLQGRYNRAHGHQNGVQAIFLISESNIPTEHPILFEQSLRMEVRGLQFHIDGLKLPKELFGPNCQPCNIVYFISPIFLEWAFSVILTSFASCIIIFLEPQHRL